MTAIYHSSTGEKLIAEMNRHNLVAAHAKLLRETGEGSPERAVRQPEIDASPLKSPSATSNTPNSKRSRPMSDLAELPDDHKIGANGPPEPNPYDAVVAHMDDLLTEAKNWADGKAIESQAQADEVERLKEELRMAAVAAEAVRVEEKRPLDEKIQAIQDRYNVYIAPLKNKKPGKVSIAIDALGATLTPWKRKLEDAARAKALEAQRIADEKAAAAAAAIQATDSANIEAREEAEQLVTEAARASADAKRAGNAKVTGLRSFFSAVMTDRRAALLHYLTANPDAITACLQQLAEQDVRAGKRQIPGFDVIEERRV